MYVYIMYVQPLTSTFMIISCLHIIGKLNCGVHIEHIIIIARNTESVEFIFRNIEELVKISLQQVTFTKSELIFWEGKRTPGPV